MNYEQALDYIHGTYKFGSKLGLENITGITPVLVIPTESLNLFMWWH